MTPPVDSRLTDSQLDGLLDGFERDLMAIGHSPDGDHRNRVMQECRNAIAAVKELQALRLSATAREWQPIETAPLETAVLVIWADMHKGGSPPSHSYDVAVRRIVGWFLSGDHCPTAPSHWQPLPEAPK